MNSKMLLISILLLVATGVITQRFLNPPPDEQLIRDTFRDTLSQPKRLAELKLEDMGGQPQKLLPSQQTETLIYLWASWCAPCLQTLSDIARVQSQLHEIPASPRFIAIALDKDVEKISAILTRADYRGTSWIASDGLVALNSGAFGTKIPGVPYVLSVDEQLVITQTTHKVKGQESWHSLLTGRQTLTEFTLALNH